MTIKGISNDLYIVLNYLNGVINITGIVPLYYCGDIAGSEFLTYAATKVYLCSQYSISGNGWSDNASPISTQFYDVINAAFLESAFNVAYWDGAAEKYGGWTQTIKDLYFSRLLNNGYTRMKFIGYRITRS